MKRIVQFTLFAVAVVFAGHVKHAIAECDDYKLAFITKVTEPVIIDGHLDEKDWKSVEPLTDFGGTIFSYNTDQFMPRTEVKLLWDEKYLYVASRCYEDTRENFEKFKVQISDPSGRVFNHDCIEFFFNGMKPGELPKHQGWMTAMPTIKSMIKYYDQGWGNECDNDYGRVAEWDQMSSIDDEHMCWDVEIRIAWTSLGITPKPGFRLGMNLARQRYDKNFVTVKGEPISIRYVQVFSWGGNRERSQHSTLNGRGILVEKMPSSVVEGLKLSYPDIDSRTILVQTDKAYVVVKGGKISELKYLEKAKSLADEVVAAYGSLAKLKDEVPEPQENFYKKNLAKADGAVAAAKAEKTKFEEMEECDVGALSAFQKKVDGWKKDIEETYWATLRQLMLVEGKVRYPVELHVTADAPELKDQFTGVRPLPWERKNDGISWLKPSVAGTKKVLFTCAYGDVYAAWDLMHRLDVQGDVFCQNDAGEKKGSLKHWQEYRWTEAQWVAMLENTLAKNEYDAYVFIGVDIGLWPLRLQCALAERLLKGAKCVVYNANAWGYTLVKDSSLVGGYPEGLIRLATVKSVRDGSVFDTEENVCAIPPFSRLNIGNGSFTQWNPGKGASFRMHTSLTPGWSYPADGTFQDEYVFAAAARVLADSLGMRGVVTLDRVETCTADSKNEIAVNAVVKNAGESATKAKIVLVVRDKWGKMLNAPHVVEAEIPAGQSHVTFNVPGLETGRYFVDAFVIDGSADGFDGQSFPKAKIADFASAVQIVKQAKFRECNCSPLCHKELPPPVITRIVPSKRPFGIADAVTATIVVSNAATGLKVSALLRDPHFRVIEKAEADVDAQTGKAVVSFPSNRLVENCHHIVVDLFDADGKLYANAEQPIYRKIGRRDDYTIFTDGFKEGGIDGLRRSAMLQYFGCDVCQNGSPTRLFNGGDPVNRDRIAGDSSENGGSMRSAYFHDKLRERIRKSAMAISPYNGLFLSIGDDSGIPLRFDVTSPDWVAPYVDALNAEFTARSQAAYNSGDKALSYKIVRDRWLEEHGMPEGDIWKYRNYGSFIKLLREAAFTSRDVELIRAACAKAYKGKTAIELFNRQNGTGIEKWADINLDLIKKMDPPDCSEFVNFIFWLRDEKYKDIAALNAAWHTEHKDFFEITQTELMDLRQKGYFGAELDRNEYFRNLLTVEFTTVRNAVNSVDPSMQVFMGCAGYANSCETGIRTLGSTCPYWGKHKETELFRSHKAKTAFFGQTLGTYNSPKLTREQRDWDVWRTIFVGCDMSWFWSTFCCFRGDQGIEDGMIGYTLDAYRDIKRGPASLLLRSKRENGGVQLLYSTKSFALEGKRDEFGTPDQARKSMMSALEVANHQYDFWFSDDIEKGVLGNREKTKTLILTDAQMLSEKEAAQIRAFVENGGTLIADYRPAVCALNGDLLDKGMLDDVFGIKRTALEPTVKPATLKSERFGVEFKAEVDYTYEASTAKAEASAGDGAFGIFINEFGKGKAVLLNFSAVNFGFVYSTPTGAKMPAMLRELVCLGGVKTPCAAVMADGSPIWRSEIAEFIRGGHSYIAFQKQPAADLETLPVNGELKFATKAWTYDVRQGRGLGFVDAIPLELTGFDTRLYARLPYEVKDVKISVPSSVKRGDTLKIDAEVLADGNVSTHVLRVDMIPPEGYSMERFAPIPYRIVDAKNGKAHIEIAIAWNENIDTFTLEVTDVATGVKAVNNVKVE